MNPFTLFIKTIKHGVVAAMGALALLSAVHATETIIYLHNDISGTPQAATDASGNLLWKESYKPYGERTLNSVVSATGAGANQLYFHGKKVEALEGGVNLSYFGARYYDPSIGRFMGIDPVHFVEGSIHSFNRYAYGNNNPYKYVDPDGHHPLLIFAAAAAVAAPAIANMSVRLAPYAQRGLAQVMTMAQRAAAHPITLQAMDLAEGLATGGPSSGVATGAALVSGAANVVNAVRLEKALASEAQMGETGIAMSGANRIIPFRGAQRAAQDHGGDAADWVKKSSSSTTSRDGTKFETHWIENTKTGQKAEFKTKFPSAE